MEECNQVVLLAVEQEVLLGVQLGVVLHVVEQEVGLHVVEQEEPQVLQQGVPLLPPVVEVHQLPARALCSLHGQSRAAHQPGDAAPIFSQHAADVPS